MRGRAGLTTRRGVAAALAVSGFAAITISAAATGASVATADPVAILAGSMPAVAASAPLIGPASARRHLTVQLWLRADVSRAEAYATAVSTPGNALFHRYLGPAEYTARFGASARTASAVASWLTDGGMHDVRVSDGRDYVTATATVAAVRSLFRVGIERYRTTGRTGLPTAVVANDRPVSLPATIASDVSGISGLNTSSGSSTDATPTVTSTSANCSSYWSQHTHAIRPAYEGLHSASLPICGYSAKQLRTAYGVTWKNTGKGQTVALTEDEAPVAMMQTLRDYARRDHLPAPTAGQFSLINAHAGTCTSAAQQAPQYDDEAQMDSEAVYAMAPRAKQVMVVGNGCTETQSLLDAAQDVLNGPGDRPRATIVSNSWQLPIGTVSPSTVNALDARAADEGVGMYFSSGDSPGLNATASADLAVAVGGTTLGLGRGGTRDFETGWSDASAYRDGDRWDGVGIGSAAGGGVSRHYRQPAYQRGVVPRSLAQVRTGKRTVLGRTVPDIAADADIDTGMRTGYIATLSKTGPGPYRTKVNGGTSLSCPLVAGLVADAQQGQRTSFGFVDPLIYRLAGTSAFRDVLPLTGRTPPRNRGAYLPADGTGSAGIDLFDSQHRSGTSQVTAKGYDTMTGLGTPNGTSFVTGLRRAAGG